MIIKFYLSFIHIKNPLKFEILWITMCGLFIKDNNPLNLHKLRILGKYSISVEN
jgi:hypothetical protein